METTALVLKTLKESPKPLKSAEIASVTGIEKTAVDKIIKILKQEDKIISPKVCFYSAR